MSLSDLFKSKKTREREANRSKRRANRQGNRVVQKALRGITDNVKKIRAKRDADWDKAKDYLRSGQKAQAENLLRSCRAKEVLASKLEKKADFWENRHTKMQASQSDSEMANAMQELAVLNNVDPENIEDSMMAMDEMFEDQTEVDHIIEREHEKDMEDVSIQETDVVPSIEDMVSELESEVAVEIESDSMVKADSDTETVKGTNREKIGTLRDRLKEVLEEEE